MLHQAMPRKKPARPIIWLIANNYINGNTLLHHGRGKDLPGTQALSRIITVAEYDPNVPGISDRRTIAKQHDTVVSCFVLNCLRPADRSRAIKEMAETTALNGSAFVAVRSAKDPELKNKQCKWSPFRDGFINPSGNLFQKFYSPEDLIFDLKKHFPTAFILSADRHYVIAQATNISLPRRFARLGVGKQMVNCVYVCRSSEQALPQIQTAKKYLPKNHEYAVIRFRRADNTFSFIQSHDFASAHEPTVGDSLVVYPDGATRLIKAPRDPWIYHHKWLMVDDRYSGFSVPSSKSRSVAWMRLNPDKSKIGKKSYWVKNILPLLS